MDRITTLFPSFPVAFQGIGARVRSNLVPQCSKVANCVSGLFASARASQVGRTLSSACSNKWAPFVVIAGLLLVIIKLFRDLTKDRKALTIEILAHDKANADITKLNGKLDAANDELGRLSRQLLKLKDLTRPIFHKLASHLDGAELTRDTELNPHVRVIKFDNHANLKEFVNTILE